MKDKEKTFRQRVTEGWQSFLAGESGLRKLMDENPGSEQIVAKCSELLAPVFSDIAFELGYNGAKYELILTPEGDRARLFPLVYFQRHAPGKVLEHWNILVGRQPADRGSYCLRMFGQDIDTKEVQVWTDWQEDKTVALSLYCEKLVPLLRENESDAYWMMYVLLDQAVGEIPSMKYVRDLKLLERPGEGESQPLLRLFTDFQKKWNLDKEEMLDASQYCNCYTAYQIEPDPDANDGLRGDVFAGVTTCLPLINAYLSNRTDCIEYFHKDGIEAGYFYYPLDGFTGENRSAKILDFRDEIEAAIAEQAGTDAVTFTGGASGIYCGYLDFIAWDMEAVFKAAEDVFHKSDLMWAGFHSFRRDANSIILKDEEMDGK